MSTFRFNLNVELSRQLMDAINEKQDISIKKEGILKELECILLGTEYVLLWIDLRIL